MTTNQSRAPKARAPERKAKRARERAGRRESSEDDLPLRFDRAEDRGDGRGLNPPPDERGPAHYEVCGEGHTDCKYCRNRYRSQLRIGKFIGLRSG